MSAQLQPKHHEFTVADYWRMEAQTPLKHEFFQGQTYAMAGTSSHHNRIAGDVTAALDNQLRGQQCETFAGDQRLKMEQTTLQTYPDVRVACSPLRYDPADKRTLTGATVIVEVLSPSTANYDRKEKFDNYKYLASLRHYLLIEQQEIKVAPHFLDESGAWRSETLATPESVVNLSAVSCRLELSKIYRRVDFEAS